MLTPNTTLKEHELRKPASNDVTCGFCGGTRLQPVWRIQAEPSVVLNACGDCHAVGASRLPTADVLDRYYSGYYTGRLLEHKATVERPCRLSKRIFEACKFRNQKFVSIVDFGGGDGVVAYLLGVMLVKAGVQHVEITIVDYEEDSTKSEYENISINQIRSVELLEAKSFSIVIASAVLEHCPAPREVLNLLLRAVMVGGLFYARTPFMVPTLRACSRLGINVYFSFPEHLYDFGEDFWNLAFMQRSAEFSLVHSRPSLAERSLRRSFFSALIARALKLPWRIFGRFYRLVGGWEVFAVRTA